jgi:hypothetical protein
MTLGDLISFQSWLKSKPKEKTRSTEQIKTEERMRKLLQENTKKLTAHEIIQMLKEYKGRYDVIIRDIERKYKL